jgi:hypothetical protein
MEKFWEWFTDKTGFIIVGWINHNRENWKLNVIGHMEEYLAKNGVGVGNDSNIYSKMEKGMLFEEIRYNQLVEAIEFFEGLNNVNNNL